MTIRVVLVDDHPVVLDGLRRAIDAVEGIEVVAVASSVAAGTALLARDDVDVAIVDLRLPDGTGTDLIAAAATRDRPATIVLSSFDHAAYVAAAVRLGAAGFLLKTAPTGDVVAAIRIVGAGGTAFTADQLRQARTAGIVMSDREWAILRLLVASKSNDEIALGLGLASKTVEMYLARMYARFEVGSRTELALRADREGWLDLRP